MRKLARASALVAAVLLATACESADATDDAVRDAPEETAAGTERESEAEDAPAEATTAVPLDGELQVHFLDVGQGDATLLVHADATVLIDQGDWQRTDVIEHLDRYGVTSIDLMITTHPHADHIGQLDRIMDRFDVEEVWWSGAVHTTQTFERAVDALEASDAAYEEPRAGDTATIGPLTIDVVNPPGDASFDDLHDSGLAVRISFGKVSLLFTGDAEVATEALMVQRNAVLLSADILQLGHHGSSTSTTQVFLDAVAPQMAIYSAGSGNTYGHPHTEVLDRLDAAAIPVYGTDVHGTITVTTDGTAFDLDTQRDGTPTPGDNGAEAGADKPSETAPPGDGCEPGQVDINSADADELTAIIHIGSDRAGQIITMRPFSSVNGLTRIDGIGPRRLADILDKGLACVD